MAPFWLNSFRFAAPFNKNSNRNMGKWVDQSGIIQQTANYPLVHLLISFWNIKHGIYVAILGLFSRYIVSRGDLRKEGRIAEIIPVDWAASEQLKRNRLLAAEGSARNVFFSKKYNNWKNSALLPKVLYSEKKKKCSKVDPNSLEETDWDLFQKYVLLLHLVFMKSKRS